MSSSRNLRFPKKICGFRRLLKGEHLERRETPTAPRRLNRYSALRTPRSVFRPRHPFFESLENRALLAGEVFPNDPLFSGQWALHNTGQSGGISEKDIDAPEAWSITTGSMRTVVAVLDNGVDYTAPDLYLNIWLNPGEVPPSLAAQLNDSDNDGVITFRDLNDPSNGPFVTDLNTNGYIDGGDLLADPRWENGVDDDSNGRLDDLVGWDFHNNDNEPQVVDGKNHGTSMAEWIGAIGNNAVGSTGVNWQVQLMVLRMQYDTATRIDANAAAAIDYAVASGATISNNSWGGGPYSQETYDAISRAGDAGHLFVAAALNNSSDADLNPGYPAAYNLDNILSVAAHDQSGQLTAASNYGLTAVDLAAPSPNGNTSTATAHTTGVAALLKSANPGWNATQLKSRLLGTVDAEPSLAGKTVTGGRLNAANALGVAQFSISDATATEGSKAMKFIDTFVAPGSGDLWGARGIDYGPDGNLYISTENGGCFACGEPTLGYVNRYDAVTGAFIDVFASHPTMTGAKDVEFGPDGNLYVPNENGDNIYRFNGITGDFIDVFVATGSGGLDTPRSLLFGPDGNADGNPDIYVTSAATHSVHRYDGVTGAFIDAFVPSQSGGLFSPTAIVFGPDGNLYVASGAHSDFHNSILRYNGATGAFMDGFIAAGSGGLTLAPTAGVSFGADVNNDGTPDMYVSNGGLDEVLIYNGASGSYLQKFITPGLGGLDDPKGFIFDSDGNLLVISNGDNSVRRYGTTSQAAFTASLSSPSSVPVTVSYSTANGTANSASDYMAATGTITFAPGQTSRTILVQALDDTAVEGNETFTVNLSNPVGGVITDSQGVGTIQDDDAGRQITISDASTIEGGELVFTVQLSTASALATTVNFATASSSATSGSDFTAASGTLTFAPGETSKTITVSTVNDTAYEPTETFTVNLTSPVGGVIADGQAIGAILDNDPQPTKFYVVDDGSANKTFEYGASGSAVEDYGLNSGNAAPRGAASTVVGDKVWVVDANKKVFVYDAGGVLLGSWTAGTLASNAQPEGIATNGADVWIVDAKSDKVFRYTGAASRLSGSQNAASSFNLASGNGAPKDIVTDGTYLWVVNDAAQDKVFKYTLAGGSLGNWRLNDGGGRPTGITLDPASPAHLWIVDSSTDRVYQYDNAAGRTSGSQASSTSFALAAGNTNPQGIADPPTGEGVRAAAADAAFAAFDPGIRSPSAEDKAARRTAGQSETIHGFLKRPVESHELLRPAIPNGLTPAKSSRAAESEIESLDAALRELLDEEAKLEFAGAA